MSVRACARVSVWVGERESCVCVHAHVYVCMCVRAHVCDQVIKGGSLTVVDAPLDVIPAYKRV